MNDVIDPPITAVREIVARALAEDLEPSGDLTSSLLPRDATATAAFVAREDGVVAGGLCVQETLFQVDDTIDIEWVRYDGDTVEPGTVIAEVSGPLASILTAERTALNFLGHLSGIATLTSRFVAAAAGGAQVWDTRKTTPGLRAIEKAAVRAGGGRNHRGNLSEWILLKDNHLAGLGITEAIARARDRWPGRTVECEADTIEQFEEAMSAGADLILLDNMTVEQVVACVEMRGDARRPMLECSGGIDLETVGAYARTGVELIALGALTHSAPVLDIGLDMADAPR